MLVGAGRMRGGCGGCGEGWRMRSGRSGGWEEVVEVEGGVRGAANASVEAESSWA